MTQDGCQRNSIPHISTGVGEEHTVPGLEDNQQRWQEDWGGGGGGARKGPQGKD